jgi:hypothetical protein
MHPRYGQRLPLTAGQGLLIARASWVVPAITVCLAMALHGTAGPRDVPFFISETDHPGPQDAVFTLGLTLTGLLQLVYAWHLYHTLEADRPRLWFFATLFGLLAAVSTVLVSHFDMYNFINPHIATAMLAFGGGIIWAFLAQQALGERSSPRGKRLRSLGFGLALFGFVVMVVTFQSAVGTFNPAGMTTEEFLNAAQAGIDFAAPAEYILVCGLLLCLASFRHELLHAPQPTPEEQG